MSKHFSCPRCGSKKYWFYETKRRRCAACRYDWRPRGLPLHLTSREWGQVAGWWVRGLSARVIALETGLNRKRVMRALLRLREAMAKEMPAPFQGTIEVDETYVGGTWKNTRLSARRKAKPSKRGRGTSKSPVFGILCRGGMVWAKVVPDVEAKTLLPLIRRRVAKGSMVCSDTFSSYTGVAARGYVHRLVEHGKGRYVSRRGTHVNGLEGFWGYLKRRLAAKGGIRRKRLPLYLADYVWRYNHRKLSHGQQIKELMKMLRKTEN